MNASRFEGTTAGMVFGAELTGSDARWAVYRSNVPVERWRQNTTTSEVTGASLERDKFDQVDKVPLLGDLPVLGNLFKSASDSTSRTRFYVLIRASILRDPGFERLKYFSDTQSDDAGATLGWPTVSPRIIR